MYLRATHSSLAFSLFVQQPWSRIHERTILLRFLGIILEVLRLEVSVYSVYITNQFQTTFAQGGLVEVNVNVKVENF